MKKTYWKKQDGSYLTKREYQKYAKQASRKNLSTNDYLEAIGLVNEFTTDKITGRPAQGGNIKCLML